MPPWAFYLVGLAYYVLAAVVLYWVLVHVEDPGGASLSRWPSASCCSTSCEATGSTRRVLLAGFLAFAVFLVALTALIMALRSYERFSTRLLFAYYLWILYDLAWTYTLWMLNGTA